MSIRLYLDPADTLAISDGRPFNQDDTGRAVAHSLFPPPPDTLYGAARVAYARALGWDGAGGWAKEITDVLGSWRDPGNFAIAGPFFRSRSQGDLLPIPAHVLLQENDDGIGHLLRLKPSEHPIVTDLGPMHMALPPGPSDLICRPLTGRWGKADAVARLLAGRDVAPDDLGQPQPVATRHASPRILCGRDKVLPGWDPDDLAFPEPRVGIARDRESRRVIDGLLYASVRRAMPPDIELFVETTGPDTSFGDGIAVPLGGESRFAFARAEGNEAPPAPDAAGRYLIYLATPAVMEAPIPGGPPADNFPGRLVTAVIPSVKVHNGLLDDRKGAARTIIPAGSVLFVESETRAEPLPAHIGADNHLGYGRYMIGVWT